MAQSPKDKKSKSKKQSESQPVIQGALLSSTATYRVYVSSGLEAVGGAGAVLNRKGQEVFDLPPEPTRIDGATFVDIKATPPNKIVCHLGDSPDGKTKAIYLVLVPEANQIEKT